MYIGGQAVNAYFIQSQRYHQPSIQPEIVNLSPLVSSLIQKRFRFLFSNVSIQDEIPETQLSTNPPLVAAEHGEPTENNDGAGSTINRKRPMKLQDGTRKRFKNEPPNSAHYGDGKLTSEIDVGNVNRDPEAAGAKAGTLKIDSVNVVTEVSTHQERETRQITSSYNENIITYLTDRLRNLEDEKRELDDTVKDRDCTIISLRNQVAALQREQAELKKTLDMRDSTIGHQAKALDFFSTTCAPVMKEL
jgi:hypothetical protein